MKGIIYILLFFELTFLAAQVGINTENVKGVFHIDAKANNGDSENLTDEQLKDDIIIDVDEDGVSIIGMEMIPDKTRSIQLQIPGENVGMLLNRVALTSIKDLVTVPNPVESMLVYNTATAGTYPDNVIPGIYYFNGGVWAPILSGVWGSVISMKDLQTDITSIKASDLESGTVNAAVADFGDITIPQKGAYTFSVRLYGIPQSDTSVPWFGRSISYVYLAKETDGVLSFLDMMEINTPMFGDGQAYTYTAVLRGLFDVGDIITIRLANGGDVSWKWISNPGFVANKTSLIYWKG